jgi:hypothetical protein
MIFREATERDLLYVAQRSISRGPKEMLVKTDFVYALEDHGEVLAVGGLKLLLPTTGWVWMVWTPKALEHRMRVYRTAKEWLELLMRTHRLKRVMAAVECDFFAAIRTVEHLGFKQESVMQKFFGNEPGYLYCKLAED